MTDFPNWLSPRRAEITDGFTVGRVLPFRGGRGVGPFVFLDHMGPHAFPAGSAADVLSHPHIGLSTVTYLFEGEMDHRDSLGTFQRIRPGDVNWMTAGKGIVHSERAPKESLGSERRFHGLQAWVALPVHAEETEPSFEHRGTNDLPRTEIGGVKLKLIAGRAFGLVSPVRTFMRLFYVDAEMNAGTSLDFDPEGQETAFYLVSGTIERNGERFQAPGLLRLNPGEKLSIRAKSDARGMILGGDPLPEHRRIWWNFVSSRPERVEEAKRMWRERKFPMIPGEEGFVPLPE